MSNKNRAIFLDRDGTINVDYGYMSDPKQLEFIEGAVEALRQFKEQGYLLIIITNQSGIGRGYFTHEGYLAFNGALCESLLAQGVEITDSFMCPHSPSDECKCRKPYPTMVLEAITKYNIDPSESYMFGDKPSDVACGEAAGVESHLITPNESLLHWANLIK